MLAYDRLLVLAVVGIALWQLFEKFPRDPLSRRSEFWRICLPVFLHDLWKYWKTEDHALTFAPMRFILLGLIMAALLCLPEAFAGPLTRLGFSVETFALVPYLQNYSHPHWLPWAYSLQAFISLTLLNFISKFLFRHSTKARSLLRAMILRGGLPNDYAYAEQLDHETVRIFHLQPFGEERWRAARGDLEAGAGMTLLPGLKGLSFPANGCVQFCGEWTRYHERKPLLITGASNQVYWYAMTTEEELTVKIGKSTRPKKRLDELRAGAPELQFYVRKSDGAPAIFAETEDVNEASLHERFARKRISRRNEWFYMHDELLDLLESHPPAREFAPDGWKRGEKALEVEYEEVLGA